MSSIFQTYKKTLTKKTKKHFGQRKGKGVDTYKEKGCIQS